MSTLGLSAVLAGLEMAAGKSGERDITYIYTDDVTFYTPRILALMKPSFLRETGYPMGIESLKAFRKHPTTAKKSSKRQHVRILS